MDRYDVVAIGGGTAGLVTAMGAAGLGLRAALIERDRLGGDCLWTGCVPSKALLASARVAHHMRHAEQWGLTGAGPAHAFGAVLARMRAARAVIAEHDDPERFRKAGIEVVFGTAELKAPDEVHVDGRLLRAKHVVIATGSGPAVPPIPGLDQSGYLSYVDAFDQHDLPPRVAIIGGGPIGLEFAQIYRRLGAATTVIEAMPRLLPREDEDASAAVAHALAGEGIGVHVATRLDRIVPGSDGRGHQLCLEGATGPVAVAADAIFVATGRRANGGALGLERIGVPVLDGAVVVDATLRSAVRSVWAAGDVTGGLQFTHVADYQAKLVLRNILAPWRAKADYRSVPWVTFTDPEVARVGLTEHEARDQWGRVRVYHYPFATLDRAVVEGQPAGFVKVITRANGRIVGATIVGHGAGELLAPLVLAMRRRIPFKALAHLVWAYPTMAEGVKRAADMHYREALAGRMGQLVRRVARWLA